MTVIHGLLQTEDYTRALAIGARQAWTKTKVEGVLGVRRIRQQRLSDKENPLHLHVVLDESALRRMVGGPEVMCLQLRHLVRIARLPTVTLQRAYGERRAHAAMTGAFTVLSFPDPDERDVQYLEHATGGLFIEDLEQVKKLGWSSTK